MTLPSSFSMQLVSFNGQGGLVGDSVLVVVVVVVGVSVVVDVGVSVVLMQNT